MPLWNIRNKLCEATTQISWARNAEERHGFWCRNGDQEFQNRKLLVQKFSSLWDVYDQPPNEPSTVVVRHIPVSAVVNDEANGIFTGHWWIPIGMETILKQFLYEELSLGSM